MGPVGRNSGTPAPYVRAVATCHPDKPHRGRGLCGACYEAARRKPQAPGARRWQELQREYGITQAEYEALLAKQGGKCATCPREHSEARPLHVDHDHRTRRVRGLLCIRCNVAIGNLEHALAPAWRAYLDEFESL